MLKKGLQTSKMCRSHWNEQTFTSQCTFKHWSLLRCGDFRNISTADVLFGSCVRQNNFQLFFSQQQVLFQKFLVLLESPDRLSLLVTVTPLRHWSALNTPKSSRVPTSKSIGSRSGYCAGQLTGPPRPIHYPQEAWFRCYLAVQRHWRLWCIQSPLLT